MRTPITGQIHIESYVSDEPSADIAIQVLDCYHSQRAAKWICFKCFVTSSPISGNRYNLFWC